MVNKMAISEFWSGDFGEKMSVGGGLGALQFFWSLERVLELLISVRMSHFATFWDHWFDTITPEKKQNKKTTNKRASVICLLAKNAIFHIFVDRGLKLLQ